MTMGKRNAALLLQFTSTADEDGIASANLWVEVMFTRRPAVWR